ncbi:FecR domain-containing protein [Chitinophaga sp. RCC_12]|uniref:FecR domain-containing protein n=1 Tax=Chitinophaga sp. RCC_12 TaxID=3239226 RepID=UPI003525C018
MRFREFTSSDFLQEPSFRSWVLDNDATATAFWEEWMSSNPDKRETVMQARQWLQVIGSPSWVPDAAAAADTWNRIEQTIDKTEKSGKPGIFALQPVMNTIKNRRWLPYAAVLAGVAVLYAAAFFLFSGGEVHQVTEMGELKTILLPDSSEIRLNVNSSVRYAEKWNAKDAREVWIEGEAFFTVTHKRNNQRFIVHTRDMDVQVTGTAFNVNTRRVQTQVVLNNGVVKLALRPRGSDTAASIIMKPGDMITYSATTNELTNKKVDPEVYSSWQSKKLLFTDTPITEVIKSLQDNLGITIELQEESLGRQTFTGTVPTDNVEVFFRTLSRSLQVTVTKTGAQTYRINQQ